MEPARPAAEHGPPRPATAASSDVIVPVRCDADVVSARSRGRSLAAEIGFAGSDLTLIATAISELTRNMLQYAGGGEVLLRPIENGGESGILMEARDEGPGIADVPQALTVGYSTSGGLGLGLPGVRRLVDSFEVTSEPGRGTVVTAVKWKR